MTKHTAHRLIDSRSVTWGELKRKLSVEQADFTGGTSTLNPSLTKHQALGILVKAIECRSDGDVVNPRNAREVLLATNVLRECGGEA